jgi:hypothetical protein
MRPLVLLMLIAGRLAAASTFYGDVLPILQRHCQVCHRAGEIGPMALTTYAEARPWAKAIKQAVLSRTMPPWFAESAHVFANDRRMSEAEIRKLADWADGGTVSGAFKAGAPTRWRTGWNIRPDVVLAMRKPMAVPAQGAVEYAYIVIPTGFRRDTWVAAAEIRPGDRRVVHHINAVIRPPGSAWMRVAKPYEPYVPPPGARDGQPDADDPQAGNLNIEFLGGYSPGMQAQRFDVNGAAKLVPAGSDIVLQLHYTASGTATEDLTRVGLTLAPGAPKRRFMSATVSGWNWEIEPGDANAEGRARMTFGEPVTLVSLQPHMHVRGKDMTAVVRYPDGRVEMLITVPRYDFNWQIVYYLAKPIALPMGTRVEVTAHWDNSANNRANPDPTKTVRWGNQSWDEMLSLPLGVLIELN